MNGTTPAESSTTPDQSFPLIPDELKGLDRWVVWRIEKDKNGTPTKVPYNARTPTRHASTRTEGTWSTFAQALFTYQNEAGIDGIGFVLLPPYVGVDLDHIRDNETGDINPEAMEEIAILNSYSELSPSETGVHVILKCGALPEPGRKSGDREVYTEGRFFTMTGKHIDGFPLDVHETDAILPLWEKWFGPSVPQKSVKPIPQDRSIGDNEIISRLGSRARALFDGDTTGYPSTSEADLALCSFLAGHTQDINTIDRIFRKSALYREKWDEQRGRFTYGDRTIRKALEGVFPVDPTISQNLEEEGVIDYKKRFALWKKDKKDQWYIAGIDRLKALAYFREKYHPVSFRGTVWLYKDGVYTPEDGRINEELTEISIQLDVQAQKATYTEIFLMLRGINLHQEMPFNKAQGVIPVQDGVLKIDFKTGEITGPHPHSPEYLFTYTLPVRYDPNADTEKLMEVFRSWVDEDDIKFLLQLPALAIIQSWGYDFKQAYLFEGPKNAGKTTYFNLNDMFIGIENRATIPLHKLLFDRFALAGLQGKLMNIVDDLESITLAHLGTFKALIGGHAVFIEQKGKDGYSGHLRAVHCFNCNEPPVCKISDDPAWWDRWVFVRFVNTFPSNPQWKKEFLTDETISAFLLLILDKIAEVMTGNVARMDSEEVKHAWMESSDTLFKFVELECERKPDGEIVKDEFYDLFVKFCLAQKRTAPSLNTCTRQMQRQGFLCSRPKKGERQVQAYRGLVWKIPPQKQVDEKPANPDTQNDEDSTNPTLHTFSKLLRSIENKKIDSTNIYKEFEKSPQTLLPKIDHPTTHDLEKSVESLTQTPKVVLENWNKPAPLPPLQKFLVVRILHDIEEFVGLDGVVYVCKSGDVIPMPEQNANILISKKAAVLVNSPSVGRWMQ